MLVVALLTVPGAHATADDEIVLVRRGSAAITRADVENELRSVPPEIRSALVSSERRVVEMLDRLLVARELAEKARARKLDADLDLAGLTVLAQERRLAAAWISSVEQEAARDFDARRNAWERRARELYLSDPSRYAAPETVVATRIFFAIKGGNPEEARNRANDARARIAAGTDFSELAMAVSDDPDIVATRGRVGPLSRDALERAIAGPLFSLREPGDVTQPIEAKGGWYIFRLESRTPARERSFDEALEPILAEQRVKEIERARSQVYAELRARNGDVTVNEPALRAMNLVPPAPRPPVRAPASPISTSK